MVVVSRSAADWSWWKMEVGDGSEWNGDRFRAFSRFAFFQNEFVQTFNGDGEEFHCGLVLVVHWWWEVVSGCNIRSVVQMEMDPVVSGTWWSSNNENEIQNVFEIRVFGRSFDSSNK